MDNKIQEGLESLERVKLLMGYSSSKTLTENIENLNEQSIDGTAIQISSNLIAALSEFWDDDEAKALSQIRRINSKTLLDKVNREIIKRKQMTLAEYINDEMSDIDSEYKSIFDHLIQYDSSYSSKYHGNEALKIVGKVAEKLNGNIQLVVSSPAGLSLTGPYQTPGGEKDGLLYKDGVTIVEKDGEGSGYYMITNNTKGDLTINNITSTYPENKVKFEYFKDSKIKPGKSTKLHFLIHDNVDKKPEIYDKPQSAAIDNTYVKKPDIRLPKINTPLPKVESNRITVGTNLGNVVFILNYDYSESYKKVLEAQENHTAGLSIPGGRRVPEGYSPFEYDEFLEKLKKLTQTCPNLKDAYDRRLNEQSVIGAPNYGDTRSAFNPNEDERKVFACNSQYKKLQSEYYNEKFPQGITKEDLVDFNKEKTGIDGKIQTFESSHMVMQNREPYSYYFDKNRLSPSLKKEYDELLKQKEGLEKNYGYDGRNMFDKFMDSGWGQLAQLGAIAILTIAGFVTEGATWVVAADMLLNLGLGSYYVARGNVREGLLFFIFAGMGKLHGIYEAILPKIGRTIAGESLEGLSKSIAMKLAGVSLDSQVALNSFMYSVLTKSERKVFRAMLSTLKENPKVVEKSLEDFATEIAKARNVYRGISITNAMKLKPALGNFAKNSFIDLAITIPAAQNGYDHLKSYLKGKGINITFGEKDNELMEYLAENKSPAQIKNLYKVMSEIGTGLNKKESQYYQKQLEKITKASNEEAKKILDKFIEMDATKTQKYKQKLKNDVLALEKKHEDAKQKVLDPEERKKKEDAFRNYQSKTTTNTTTLPIPMSSPSTNDTLK
jgi:hypothetical protein